MTSEPVFIDWLPKEEVFTVTHAPTSHFIAAKWLISKRAGVRLLQFPPAKPHSLYGMRLDTDGLTVTGHMVGGVVRVDPTKLQVCVNATSAVTEHVIDDTLETIYPENPLSDKSLEACLEFWTKFNTSNSDDRWLRFVKVDDSIGAALRKFIWAEYERQTKLRASGCPDYKDAGLWVFIEFQPKRTVLQVIQAAGWTAEDIYAFTLHFDTLSKPNKPGNFDDYLRAKYYWPAYVHSKNPFLKETP